jgi:hypothetical protein
MLHAHTDVALLPETHFFRRYVARYPARYWYEKRGTEAFRARLENDPEFQRAKISADELLAPFAERPLDLADVYRQLLARYRERENVSVVGAKDPRMLDYLPRLRALFPDAHVLHIVRDPRDVLLSRRNASWSAGRPDWLHVLTYRAQMRWGRREGRQSFGRRYVELRYEDLLHDPESILQQAVSGLPVSFSEAMLEFASSAQDLVGEEEASWKEETMGPLLRDNTQKWRSGLQPVQIRLAEQVCQEAFQAFGYAQAGAEAVRLSASEQRYVRFFGRTAPLFDYAYLLRREIG